MGPRLLLTALALTVLLANSALGQAAPQAPAAGAAAAAEPGPVTITATPGKAEVGVGEVFTLELAASGPPGTTYEFVREAGDETLELRTAEPAADAAPLPAGVHRYAAAVFALTKAEIPPLPVRYRLADGTRGEAQSAPVSITITSRLPKDPEQQKLADIRGPQPVAIGPAFWIALVLAAALLAAAAAWLVRRRRRKVAAPAPPAPVVPPDVEARRALAALAASPLLARGEHRAFYIQLTAIAKRYLERRLGAPVLEMTTAETLAFLRGHPLGSDLLATVRDVAESADRIKFAKGEGLAAEAERHLAAVRELVSRIEARLAPAPPGKEQAA